MTLHRRAQAITQKLFRATAPARQFNAHVLGFRPEGDVLFQYEVVAASAAGQDEHGAIAQLDAAEDVGFHGVSDHDGLLGGQAQLLARPAHHDGAGLADGKGLDAGGGFEHGDDGAAAGPGAVLSGAVGVEVGGDEPCPSEDHVDRLLHHLGVEGSALADDDEIRVFVDDGESVLMQGVKQAALADDERGAAGFLAGEESGGGHGAGEDMFLTDADTEATQFRRHVATGALTVVGQKRERDFAFEQGVNEPVGTGNQIGAPVDHAIHVNEIAARHGLSPFAWNIESRHTRRSCNAHRAAPLMKQRS